MRSELERVTPERAAKYLEDNEGNRPIRQLWVDSLAKMIERGEWHATHQGIAFSKKGRLLDGQHRLLAIVQAGKGADILVTRGLSEDVFRHIDGGRVRLMSDRVKLTQDVQENRVCVALVRGYLDYGRSKEPGDMSVDAIEKEFIAMSDAYYEVARAFRTPISRVTRADVGAALVVYLHSSRGKGREFLASYVTGQDLAKSSPVLMLREALISGRVGRGHQAYWKAVAATKAHKESRPLMSLSAATEDMAGNRYERLVLARSRKGSAAAETRYGTKRVAVGV